MDATLSLLEAQAFGAFVKAKGRVRDWHSAGFELPRMAGGSPVVQHPLAAPTLSGNLITVDLMLQQPTRITRYLSDITLQAFLMDRVLDDGGSVSGGAVIYDPVGVNDLYAARDVEQISPGAEFPIITSERQAPLTALVEKWGGKTWISDEARDRNDQVLFQRELRKLGNTIVRKLNQRTIDVLNAAIALDPRHTFAGHSWSAAVLTGNAPTVPSNTPAADIALAQRRAFEDELGINYNLLVVNPQEATTLGLLYGAFLDQMLSNNGVNEMYVTNRQPAGQALMISKGNVGQRRVEKPLSTVTFREEETERTWTQSGVRVVMFVDNAYGVVQLTGIA